MNRYLHPAGPTLTVLALGLALLAPGGARAANTYTIQPIIKLGDTVGEGQLKVARYLDLDDLNDSGQMMFIAANAAGGEMLVQYAEGKFTVIAARGMDSPVGKWPGNVSIDEASSMNQKGNVVFAAVVIGSGQPLATCLWDRQAQKLTAVVLKGMPAVNDWTFEGGGFPLPSINNQEEIAFPAQVKNAAGLAGPGIFLRGSDGAIRAIALPDQEMPGGGKLTNGSLTSINDQGLVAFDADTRGGAGPSLYLWESGTLTRLLAAGDKVPGGTVSDMIPRLNNKNRNVLIEAFLKGQDPTYGDLYLWTAGQLKPVALPGQEMPGGGQLRGLYAHAGGISFANAAGQHVFTAKLKDGSTGAYLMEADGSLSLVLKSGMTTDLGVIRQVGDGALLLADAAVNSQGQVALVVRIQGAPDALVLLTPTKP